MKELEFKPNAKEFEICWLAITDKDPRQPAPELSEWDDFVAVIKSLKAISAVDPKNPNQRNCLGGKVKLEDSHAKLLVRRINRPIWIPESLEHVVETRQWIENAK